MIKSKKLITFLIALIISVNLFSVKQVAAQDLTITFNEDTCALAPDAGALFSELDVKPGDEIVRTLEVINDSGEEVSLGIKMTNIKEPALFYKLSEVLDLKIVNNNTGEVLFSEMTMADWKNQTLTFPTLKIDDYVTDYSFSISMDSALNNDYQEKEFDFDLDFQCDGLSEDKGDIKGDEDTRDRLPDTGESLLVAFFGLSLISLRIFFHRRKSKTF